MDRYAQTFVCAQPKPKRLRHERKKEQFMYRIIAIALSLGTALGIAYAAADPAAKPTDPQIAHIAYTAGQLDIEAGKQALDKSKNKDVRAFAQQMVADHSSVNAQALALVKKLNVTPVDNATSQSLTPVARNLRAWTGPHSTRLMSTMKWPIISR